MTTTIILLSIILALVCLLVRTVKSSKRLVEQDNCLRYLLTAPPNTNMVVMLGRDPDAEGYRVATSEGGHDAVALGRQPTLYLAITKAARRKMEQEQGLISRVKAIAKEVRP